ncbi:hypothetical protein BH09VER1_BH09VER1_45660 [soil metagenome]
MAENTQAMRELERRRGGQRLAMAYQRVFASEEGQAVLRDLTETFRLHERVFTPVQAGGHFAYDPLTAALADGGRAVVLHILAKLAVVPQGDGNLSAGEVVQR